MDQLFVKLLSLHTPHFSAFAFHNSRRKADKRSPPPRLLWNESEGPSMKRLKSLLPGRRGPMTSRPLCHRDNKGWIHVSLKSRGNDNFLSKRASSVDFFPIIFNCIKTQECNRGSFIFGNKELKTAARFEACFYFSQQVSKLKYICVSVFVCSLFYK